MVKSYVADKQVLEYECSAAGVTDLVFYNGLTTVAPRAEVTFTNTDEEQQIDNAMRLRGYMPETA